VPPTRLTIRIARHCAVVNQPVTLSRERVLMDYLLLSETSPTCSNIHACLAAHGDIKHISDCLLHTEHLPPDSM
jgi:hypothetical protein